MNWGIMIAGGGLVLATLGFLFPIVLRTGKTEQRVDGLEKDVRSAHDNIRKVEGDVSDLRVLMERVDVNTQNIKETVEKLEERK
jgi:hypothetical protein